MIEERRAWKALGALSLGLFVTLLDQSLVAVALPAIRADLGATLNQSVWVSAVYLLTFAVPLLITGRLGDRYGQRNVYLVGMAVFTLAAAACVFAPSIEWLIVARAVQGFGGSLLNPQPLSIIHRIFAHDRRGAATGVWSAVASSAGLFGPVIGGMLVGWISWRAVFLVYVPLGVISLVMVARYVPKLPTGTSKIDWLSGAVSLLAVLGIVLALQQGPELGWGPLVWASLIGGIAGVVLFVWMQTKSKAPLMPLRLFQTHNFAIGAFSIFGLGFTVYSVNLPIMLYLQTAQGLSSQLAGVMLVPMGIISVVMSPLVGRLVDRLAPGMISRVGFATMIGSMSLMVVMMVSNVSPWWIVIPIVLLGASNAMCFAPNSATALRDVPQDLVGSASGFYNTSRQVGAVVGAATLGAVMQMAVGTVSFGVAMGLAIAVTLVPLACGLFAVTRFK
ncbi:major facilitator superfamily permease [Corynebacterium deserti GIMN1.010]|uniref:Major facilitator superfamily permease n=1 Tax=Corynebacterium deserti GIMN1.010 TaxID=931089 RepID=A0A0M4CIU2_9CORY|nr:DHA2 family efflux MFS transporter permease subunit [Corynebacterium deserti]ALC05538.1 major facilitator superfamily permease [Corynebacterium deserti GIMN1.010]